MKIHTPSAYGLGILAGLEGRGTYDNPYDDYLDQHDHQRWDTGYDEGQKLRDLITEEV